MSEMAGDTPSPARTERRIPELQALRGVAAAMVVAIHCIACWQPILERNPVSREVRDLLVIPISGRAPVIVFFVLSGFVLSGSLERRSGAGGFFRRFYLQRLFRIVPAAWIALGLMFAVRVGANALITTSDTSYLPDFILAPLQASAHSFWMTMLFVENGANPAYWTLYVELMGSLLLPLLFAVLIRVRDVHQVVVAWCLAFALALLPFVPLRISPLSHMASMLLYCFGLGLLIFVLLKREKLRGWAGSAVVGIGATAILLFAHWALGPESYAARKLGNSHALMFIMGTQSNSALFIQHLIEALASSLLVAHVAVGGIIGRRLRSRGCQALGDISYSLYVVHLPILILVMSLVLHQVRQLDAWWTMWLPFLTFFAVMLVAVPISMIFFRWIERPGVAAGRAIAAGMSKRSATIGMEHESGCSPAKS